MSEIEFSDVSLALDGVDVLSSISLRLSEHRVGIVGQNGSGKSSFARLLAGLVAPTSGVVYLNDVDVFKERRSVVSQVGVIFQNPDHQIIFPTVLEEIAFGLQQQGSNKDQAFDVARQVLATHGRVDWADKPTHTLSQGQRHYLCLMAVLAMEPQLMLLDEPYAGLDIPTQMQLMAALQKLPQKLVLVTHDPAALSGFDRVIWLDAGGVFADGTPDVVLPKFTQEMQVRGDALCSL